MTSKVLIIGASASGIAAATRLYENGINDFIIIEAENRIGGRIHTIPFGKHVVDLGGEWCTGEKGNVVYELAESLNAVSPSKFVPLDYEYRRSNGTILDKAIADKITARIFEVQSNYEEEWKISSESLGKFNIDKVNHIVATKREYSEIQQFIPEVISIFQKVQNAIDGVDNWFETSARGYADKWVCEGTLGLHWKDRGFKTILDILLKRFPDPSTELPIVDKIQFNKTVKQINWHGECSTQQQVEVVCEDGTTMHRFIGCAKRTT